MNEQITLSLDAGPSPVLIAGVDEVGRGPLAGPVVAAAVILHPERPIDGLNDSKKLSERQRERLAAQIHERAMAVSIAEASVAEIDEINILQATWRAMCRAVDGLSHRPARCLIDGNQCPKLPMPATAVVGGDGSEACISAASIVAKVHRDRMMVAYAETYPGYGFERHKGYGTAVHMAALAALGVTPLHRRSFKPIGDMVLQAGEGAV